MGPKGADACLRGVHGRHLQYQKCSPVLMYSGHPLVKKMLRHRSGRGEQGEQPWIRGAVAEQHITSIRTFRATEEVMLLQASFT